jgi:ribosomal protein L32
MSLDIFELIWELSQDSQIRQNAGEVAAARDGVDSAREEIRDLRTCVFRLTRTCQVLCNVLTEKLGIPADELKSALVKEMNLEAVRQMQTCPSCGHTFHPNRTKCLYCGYAPER